MSWKLTAGSIINPVGTLVGESTGVNMYKPWMKYDKNMSEDQKAKQALDPYGIFGDTRRTHFLGDSRTDMNTQGFYNSTENDYAPQFQSSYSGMLRR